MGSSEMGAVVEAEGAGRLLAVAFREDDGVAVRDFPPCSVVPASVEEIWGAEDFDRVFVPRVFFSAGVFEADEMETGACG